MLLPSTRAQQHIVLNKTEVFWGGGKRRNKLCMPNACIQCFKINLSEAGYPQIPFLEGEEHQYRPTAKERMAAWQEEPRPWQAFTAGIFSPHFFAWIDSCPAWPRGEAQGWVTHRRSQRAQRPRRTRGQRAPPWPPSWPLAALSLQWRESRRLARCHELLSAAKAGRGAGDSSFSTENCFAKTCHVQMLEISFVPSLFNTCLKPRLLKACALLLEHHAECGEVADTCVFKANNNCQ